MALKADRHELATDISFFMDETATRGGVATVSTGGSGAALDQSGAKVSYTADASGAVPAGLLLNDMVNLDLTRQHINWHNGNVVGRFMSTKDEDGYAKVDVNLPNTNISTDV